MRLVIPPFLLVCLVLLLLMPWSTVSFARTLNSDRSSRATVLSLSSSSTSTRLSRQDTPKATTITKSPSIGQSLLNLALQSPLWKHVLVPQARSKMQQTAESNGIRWKQGYDWICQEFENELQEDSSAPSSSLPTMDIPAYYHKPFHAYEGGNLSWQAAFELELASCAVGARNVPLEGKNGENAFRALFETALLKAGAEVPVRPSDHDGGGGSTSTTIVDFGCATGISTRRLAHQWPQATEIIGIDLSPYFIRVGERLLELQPKSTGEGGPWVSTIVKDDRISFRVGDIQDTSHFFDKNSVDVVQLQFVAHELPPSVAKRIVDEAHRILKPGGQFWMSEMDFEAPAYAAQRANPLLFSLIRATEPYLDDYADSASELRTYIAQQFSTTTVVAATGRHFALVATKGSTCSRGNQDDAGKNDGGDEAPHGVLHDFRFGPDGKYCKEDTHLKVWENKQES